MFDLQGYGPILIQGTLLTIKLGLASLFFGLIFGLLGACAKLSNLWILQKLANIYTTVVRGIPELLMVFFIFYGGSVIFLVIAKQLGYQGRINISEFWAGVVALSVMFGAYATEVFRMAIQDIPKGQFEAAESLGMTPFQTWTRIILPQMWLVALPGLGNLTLVLLKDTALVSLIGLKDLMYFAQRASQATQKPFTFYLAAALIYLALTSIITLFVMWCEARANPAARYAKMLRKQSRGQA
ncbi:amino acid ABC transporter membrane protein 1, PAAT family [Moraxella cuniculi DSM 21768]|uniref:Amino acid ABC transporter membrane protein 1, PAAT family n=1 Tax=Moraxella cuniculi DSM 21768 TaxID=1122245 RepID=A0A1N7EC14_9GAMM|nr:ABC transporter permease subunit [Moraxella cuniculi]OOS05406.1 ABC transporter permease [Moraxella cuniculi]SIR85693.1 amino acid ABC transporter membrane protein 1, PAAT family [Moraxella cuniculi DSM 21768]